MNMISNPFDVLTQAAFEIARSALYLNSRYRNTEMSIDTKEYECMCKYFERITEQYKIIGDLSQDEVDTLRSISYISENNNLERLNTLLYGEFKQFRTEYSNCYPYVGVDFEKLTLGEDSAEFKRREELRSLCDTDKRVTLDFLYNSQEFLNRGVDYCKKFWGETFTDDYCSDIKDLLEEHNLQENELCYMESYIRNR